MATANDEYDEEAPQIGIGDFFGAIYRFFHNKKVSTPPKVVALAGDVVEFSLPELGGKLCLSSLDPRQPSEREGPNDLSPFLEGRRDRNVPIRRIYRDVNVLDGFASHRDTQIANFENFLSITHSRGWP